MNDYARFEKDSMDNTCVVDETVDLGTRFSEPLCEVDDGLERSQIHQLEVDIYVF